MSGVFELFHLSLHEKVQGDLFEQEIKFTREQWLRHAFNSIFAFDHRGKKIHWVPSVTDANVIGGNLVRSHNRIRHKPPEEGGVEELASEWQGAILLIDPNHHDDGQKIAFEKDPTLGSPESVLRSMCLHINYMPKSCFVIEPQPIFNEKTSGNGLLNTTI